MSNKEGSLDKVIITQDKLVDLLLHAATRDDIAKLDTKIDDHITKLETKIDKLDTKIDDQVVRLEAKIDKLETKTDNRFSQLETRMDRSDSKLDRIFYSIVVAVAIAVLQHWFVK